MVVGQCTTPSIFNHSANSGISMTTVSTAANSGRIVTLIHDSKLLKGNALGDPHQRKVSVYLPAAYDVARNIKRRFVTLYDLAGFTGSGLGHLNWRNFDENLPEKLDRLIQTRRMPPVIVVFPDCFTRLGGNQYINSSAVGRYADYLNKELVPFVDRTFRTLADSAHRGCFGKSSGGYGAMRLGMSSPDIWGAIANHSGDAHFDFVYGAEWPAVLTHLQNFAPQPLKPGRRVIKKQSNPGQDDGRVKRFLEYVANCPPNGEKPLSGNDIMTLMLIAMAATYDPEPTAPNGFNLPFDLNTGARISARWRQWMKHDPINLVRGKQKQLRNLRGIYIDCGWRDQFHIHYGSRQLSLELGQHGIEHRYEEFSGTHSGIDHRLDISLPFLAKSLAP